MTIISYVYDIEILELFVWKFLNRLISFAYNHCLYAVILQNKIVKLFLSQGFLKSFPLKSFLICIRIIDFYSCKVFSSEILEA